MTGMAITWRGGMTIMYGIAMGGSLFSSGGHPDWGRPFQPLGLFLPGRPFMLCPLCQRFRPSRLGRRAPPLGQHRYHSHKSGSLSSEPAGAV